MPKLKIIISICIFSILLGITSIIKTKTRIIEKKVYKIDKKIEILKKDLHETQLDYSYLSSPNYISKKKNKFNFNEYFSMDYSRIYLSIVEFNNAQTNITTLKSIDEKNKKK